MSYHLTLLHHSTETYRQQIQVTATLPLTESLGYSWLTPLLYLFTGLCLKTKQKQHCNVEFLYFMLNTIKNALS